MKKYLDIIFGSGLVIFGVVFFVPAHAMIADHVIITEVVYDHIGPENEAEWVEIFNPTNTSVDLTGWTLKEGVTPFYTFGSTTIGPGAYLVLANDAAAFTADNPGITPDIDMSGGSCNSATECIRLNNTGDSLTLTDGLPGVGTIVDFIAWEGAVSGWNSDANPGESVCRSTSNDTDTPADMLSNCSVSPAAGGYASTPPIVDSSNAVSFDKENKSKNKQKIKKPKNVSVICHIDGTALLTWRDRSSRESGNMIERRSENGIWSLVKDSRTRNRETWTDTGLKNNIIYTYRIRSWGGNKKSGYSQEVSCRASAK